MHWGSSGISACGLMAFGGLRCLRGYVDVAAMSCGAKRSSFDGQPANVTGRSRNRMVSISRGVYQTICKWLCCSAIESSDSTQ